MDSKAETCGQQQCERKESIRERETTKREYLYEYIDETNPKIKEAVKKKFKDMGKFDSQWSDMSYNILDTKYACFNDCKYCYVKPMFRRFGIGGDREVTLNPKLDTKRVAKGWRKTKTPKIIMFPTSHDIFPGIVKEYISVARKMLNAGHQLLCVSKPRMDCITRICDELVEFKDSILFRFTIGSDDNDVLEHWEPNAPKFEERLDCLRYAFNRGYQTSVSMEPMLSEPYTTIEKMLPFVTDSIWLGFVSQIPKDDIEDIVFEVDLNTKKKFVRKCLERYKENDKIYWKESIYKFVFKYM